MQQKSLGRQIWEVLSPLLVHFGVTFVVEFIIIMIYYMSTLEQLLAAVQSTEAMVEYTAEMMNRILEYAVEMTTLSALAALPFLIWMKHRDTKKEKAAGLVPNKKAPLTKYVLIAGISIPLAIGLNNIMTLSNLAEYSEAYQTTAEALYTPSLWIQIICLGCIVPITEEYIFRGLIFKRIRSNTTATRAIVLSALFFGLYHGNMVQMIYGILCGLLLAYLYEKYGSLKAPVFAHVIMNLTALLLTDVNAFTWMFTKPMRMAVITVACATLTSTMFLVIQKIDEKP